MLLATALRLRAAIPDFELLVVGTGPQAAEVAAFAQAHPWAHALGVRTGADKVAAMSLADVMLNPGLVGLSILDSFVCGVPMLTTDCGLHSPEIAYLEDGVNGLMTEDSLPAYAAAVQALLLDGPRLHALRAGCERAAAEYTIERMAERFLDGIEDCLRVPALEATA